MKKISLIIPISLASVASIGCQLNRQYTVNFKNYDGSVLQSTKIDGGKKATYTGDTPTRAGDEQYTYTFSGWDKSLDDEIRADTDFVAQFTSVTNKYTVTFDTRGGEGEAPAAQTIEYGKTADKPKDPVRGEYAFINWYTKDYQVFDFSTPVKSDLTLYAGWGRTVKFEPSDSTTQLFNPQKVIIGGYAKFPGKVDPPQDQLFYGWKYKTGEKTGQYFDFSKTEIIENVTLEPAFGNVELEIEGEHNINVNSSSQTTLKAYGSNGAGGRRELIVGDDNDGLVWEVVEGYQNIVNIDKNGKLTVPSNSPGGTAYVLAYAENKGGVANDEKEYFYGVHEVQVASFNYIKLDSFKNNIVESSNASISGKLVIPEKYWDNDAAKWIATDNKVIKASGFSDCSQLTSVIIPENITEIGSDAFRCIDRWSYAAIGKISSVVFRGESKIEKIGCTAFDSQKLTSIKFPKSLKTIEPGAFYKSTLKSVTFEDQTNTTWNLTPSSESKGTSVTIDIRDYTDEQLAQGFNVYSDEDPTYGKGDYYWNKQA